MSTRIVYCPHCGAVNQEGQEQCFACQEKLSNIQADSRAWEPNASEISPWQNAPQSVRAEHWQVDQPTGPIPEIPARPVSAPGPGRRGFLTGLVIGGGAAGIAAFAALRFLPGLLTMGKRGPATSAPASTPMQIPTSAELTVDTSQAGRLTVHGRSDLLQMAWKPALTNDTRMLAVSVSANESSHLYCWDSVSAQFHQFLQISGTLGTQSLAWEPAGDRLAVAQPGSIVLGRLGITGYFDARADVPVLLPSSGSPPSLAWLPNRQGILYTMGQEVFLWTMQNAPIGHLVYDGHTSDLETLVPGTFVGLWPSPDGQYVASTSNMMTESADGTNNDSQIMNPLHIWRVGQNQSMVRIPALPNGFTRLQWSPDSRYLVYGNNIQGLSVYDVPTKQTVIRDFFPYPGDASGYSPLSAWLQNGSNVALPKYVGTDPLPLPVLQIFEAASGRVVLTLEGYHYPIAVSSARDNRLAVCYMPGGPQSIGNLLVWYDGATGKQLGQQPLPSQVNDLQWMPDGTELAVCATDLVSVLNVWVYGQ